MSLSHEYVVLGGLNRAHIGHYIGLMAAILSSAAVAGVHLAINLLKFLGYGGIVPQMILWPIGAASIYTGLYWWFEKYLWKHHAASPILKVPNLEGKWTVSGHRLGSAADGAMDYEWSGEVVIVQSWDKIQLALDTGRSGSDSIAASLQHDPARGFRLMYTYRNRPHTDQPDLKEHIGYAEMVFPADLKVADGDYFNGRDRYSYGTMRWERII